MARRDIESVYCLNASEYDAFKMYFEGSTVPQISHALNMSTTQAGHVLDSARGRVWGGMTEKRENRGEVSKGLVTNHGNAKESNQT
jgi:hypothetical protein